MKVDITLAETMTRASKITASAPTIERNGINWFRTIAILLALAVFAYLLLDGADYYLTPYSERPHHTDYREFRPAGDRGLAYGFIGAAMMILMLTYSLRKRTRMLGKLFTLRRWLDFHIFLGIFGPLLIVLHTSFKVQGLVAVAFWSMVAVALSGYLGRYLYIQIPRNIEGKELSLAEIEQNRADFNQRLQTFGLSSEDLAEVERLSLPANLERQGSFRLLVGMLAADIMRPVLVRRVERRLRTQSGVSLGEYRQAARLAVRRTVLRRRVIALEKVQELFHYWHVVHKPFAIIMYLIMIVHIGVAIWTGYTWIF